MKKIIMLSFIVLFFFSFILVLSGNNNIINIDDYEDMDKSEQDEDSNGDEDSDDDNLDNKKKKNIVKLNKVYGGFYFVPDNNRERKYKGGVRSISISPDSKFIITTLGEKNLKIWKVNKSNKIEFVKNIFCDGYMADAIYSYSGKYIAALSLSRSVKIFDSKTFELVKTIKGNRFNGISFTSDDKYLITGESKKGDYSLKSKIRFWDYRKGKMVKSFKTKYRYLGKVSITKDKKYIYHSASISTPHILMKNAFNGRLIKTLYGHNAGVRVRISDNFKNIISHCSHWKKPSELFIWNPSNGNILRKFRYKNEKIRYAAVSPDNRFIVSVTSKKGSRRFTKKSTIYFYNYKTGGLVKKVKNLVLDAKSIRFSPNQKYIIVAGRHVVKRGNIEGRVFILSYDGVNH